MRGMPQISARHGARLRENEMPYSVPVRISLPVRISISSVFHVSDTTVLSAVLKSPWRVTSFVAVANALLAPFTLPHLVLRTLLFAKLRPSVAQFR